MGIQDSLYIGNDRIVTRTAWGGHVVAPSFNIDTAIGSIRDGAIEPWTTRLIQELVRPGQYVINGGANYGYYAALSATIGARVVAVDANPYIIPYLLLTRFWSGTGDRIEIFHRALWKTKGDTVEFKFDPQYLGGGGVERLGPKNAEPVLLPSFEGAIWAHDNIQHITDASGEILPGRGMYVRFSVETTTIDSIVPDDQAVDLIHLDIEGAEAAALLGARKTIERSPNLKLVTEWSSTQICRNPEVQQDYEELWAFLTELGFRPRLLRPLIHQDGGIYVSRTLDREHMIYAAEHGDYIWCKPEQDPWANMPSDYFA